MLIIVVIAIVALVLYLTHLVRKAPMDTEIWPVMERDPSWDHALNCRCRTCRN